MKLGMVGLGRMGGNMAKRLRDAGYEVVGYALSGGDVDSLEQLVASLPPPRVVWVMVPAGDPTETTIAQLGDLLAPGDVVVDGGNSYFRHTLVRGQALAERGIDLVDCGTSGGIWGLTEGYCLMAGGRVEAIAALEPILRALAPENGWLHVGPSGAGHFVKMVHNGIEYGLMQAYAEGLEILERSRLYELDLRAIADVWRHGSVVRSWLLDLTVRALDADPALDRVAPFVPDSGEGRWTLLEAIEEDVPTPAIASSLFARFASRDDNGFGLRLLAALRQQFGGHAIKDR